MKANMLQFPADPAEALALALHLAITAPSEEKAQQCIEIAERLAADMRPEEVENAQAVALYMAGGEKATRH